MSLSQQGDFNTEWGVQNSECLRSATLPKGQTIRWLYI